jgi:DNA-binding HxlR family transcriptional regulator
MLWLVSRSYEQLCPVAVAVDVVGDRWSLLLLRDLLWHGPMRFGELEDRNPGLSTSLLTARLRDLEHAGLLERVGDPVHYRLSETGHRIRSVIDALYEFGRPLLEDAPLSEDMLAYVLASIARRRYRDVLKLDRSATVQLRIDGYEAVVTARPGFLGFAREADVNGTLTCSQAALVGMLGGVLTLEDAVTAGSAAVTGDAAAVRLVADFLQSEATVNI